MALILNPQPSDIATANLSAAPSAPYGTTSTVDTLGLAAATDGSAGNVTSRIYYCTQGGVSGTITDTYTYGAGSIVNGNPTGLSRGAFQPFATGFTTSLSASTEPQGVAITVTFTPSGGAWPAGVVLTPVAQTITGTFVPATLSPVGTAPVTCQFTPSNVASGSISATASPGMTNLSGGQADTSTAVVGTTISSAVINAAGTQVTLTFNQAVTLGSGFALTVNGAADAVTFGDAATSSATHVGTLAATAYTGQAASYATTATTFTSPALAATASGVSVTNNSTAAAPTGTTITFTGASGAPTGNQVLTALGSSSVSGFTLDGSGGMYISSTNYQYGAFAGPGVQNDGTLTYTYKSGRYLAMIFRANVSTTTYYVMFVLGGGTGAVTFYKIVNGAASVQIGSQSASGTVPSGATSVGVKIAGNTFTVMVNGAATSVVFTDNSITANGLIGVGSADAGAGTVISQVSIA